MSVRLRDVLCVWDGYTRPTADFSRFESHSPVSSPSLSRRPRESALSKQNRGGRDEPGHDPEIAAGGIGISASFRRRSLLRRGRTSRRRRAQLRPPLMINTPVISDKPSYQ
jgi:hypothetical protein